MIVGPDWIWLHFPKCAGSYAQVLLKQNFGEDNSVEFDKLDINNIIWHESITQRQARVPGFSTEGKRIVVIFRRLPDWMLSRVHYEASRPPHHLVSREQLCQGIFLTNSGIASRAEDEFNQFSNPIVDTWIRMEDVHKGFEQFFGKHLEPVKEKAKKGKLYAIRDRILGGRPAQIKRRINENKFGYIRDHKFWFTKAELEELYHAAPNWAATEKRIYGELLV